MRPIGLTRAVMACLVSMAHVAVAVTGTSSEVAQQALQAYLDAHPITTASQSQATLDLQSVEASILAGNYTTSRPWKASRNPCPGSCTSLGVNSTAWPAYHSVDRLSRCDETMLLSFALYTDLDGAHQVSIRGCTADLYADSTSSSNSSCEASPANETTTVTSSLQLGWNTAAATGSASEAVDALEQLLAYESINPLPCNETINFAYSGQTSVGVYMGSALHRQGLLSSIIQDLIERIDQEGVTETQVVQLCGNNQTVPYTMGIIINSNQDLLSTQQAVQTWRNASCVTALDSTSTWSNLTFTTSVQSQKSSNSTYNWKRRSAGAKVLARDDSDADGDCTSYLVQMGDTCSALATTYDITVDDIEDWNTDTWGWMGCDDVIADEYICLSSGWPPMPAVISNAVCGPQVNGTATVPHGTDLSTLNECPLNACCDKWGQCGITSDFCTQVNSTTNAPGTSANGTNGCISNCGTQIIESDSPPAENYVIGYFEGFDLERPCLNTLITDIDTSAYTHIHMSFATLNTDFSFNISSIEDQMDGFMDLEGVKRVITVGGWSFSTDPSTYDIFREAVSTSDNRDTLITNTIDFLNTYDLDGIDWDWEYPGEPDIPDIPADTSTSAEDFFLFLKDLSEQMPSGKTLSTTAPSSFWYMKAYPIYAISQVVDYIVMMTYDMHGQWDWNNTNTDPGCPTGGCLRSHVNLTETLSSMSMITKAGVSSNMVALGVSSYARSFLMSEAGCYGPDCQFTGPDSGAYAGPCTQTAGYISNAELFAIADEDSIYTYIDQDSNSNIMVWNETQWAGFMDAAIKDARRELYEDMNFLGTADWAIDLQNGNTSTFNSSQNGTATATRNTVYIDPAIWSEATPLVTIQGGDMIIMPPKPLSTNTTFVFDPWPTQLTWQSSATETTTFWNSEPFTYLSLQQYTIPTLLSIPDLNTHNIPVWYQEPTSGQSTLLQTSSVRQTPFPVVFTPIVGGNTTVIGGTTSIIPAFNYTSGNYTYATTQWTGVFGGVTHVDGGTTLAPTTTTVTPHPHPTTGLDIEDPELNTKTTQVKSATDKGDSGPSCTPSLLKDLEGESCGGGCAPYCHWGCADCAPDGSGGAGGGGGGSDDGGGDDNNDGSSTQSDSSSTTSGSSAPITLEALITGNFEEPSGMYSTVPVTVLEAIAAEESGLIKSLYGAQINYVLTASSGITGPPATATAATSTADPYSYTITDGLGDVVACSSELVLEYEGEPSTVCVGDVTTISTAPPTSTEIVVITVTVHPTTTTTSSTSVSIQTSISSVSGCPGGVYGKCYSQWYEDCRTDCIGDEDAYGQVTCEGNCGIWAEYLCLNLCDGATYVLPDMKKRMIATAY